MTESDHLTRKGDVQRRLVSGPMSVSRAAIVDAFACALALVACGGTVQNAADATVDSGGDAEHWSDANPPPPYDAPPGCPLADDACFLQFEGELIAAQSCMRHVDTCAMSATTDATGCAHTIGDGVCRWADGARVQFSNGMTDPTSEDGIDSLALLRQSLEEARSFAA